LEKQEYNGGGELFPNTLYACLELSQWSPWVLLTYANSKVQI
jgi:hypothetical protein